MHDWNVVITVHEEGFNKAFHSLGEFGPISRTGFYNVLVMRSSNVERMMDTLRDWISEDPGSLSWLARVVPVTHTFEFQDVETFRSRAIEIVQEWVSDLGGKSFHVRIHRRGFKGRLSSWDEERHLNEYLLDRLQEAGTPGRISFGDPDAVIAIETIGQSAGISFWTRNDMEKFPFLHLIQGSKTRPEIVTGEKGDQYEEGTSAQTG